MRYAPLRRHDLFRERRFHGLGHFHLVLQQVVFERFAAGNRSDTARDHPDRRLDALKSRFHNFGGNDRCRRGGPRR